MTSLQFVQAARLETDPKVDYPYDKETSMLVKLEVSLRDKDIVSASTVDRIRRAIASEAAEVISLLEYEDPAQHNIVESTELPEHHLATCYATVTRAFLKDNRETAVAWLCRDIEKRFYTLLQTPPPSLQECT